MVEKNGILMEFHKMKILKSNIESGYAVVVEDIIGIKEYCDRKGYLYMEKVDGEYGLDLRYFGAVYRELSDELKLKLISDVQNDRLKECGGLYKMVVIPEVM